MNGDNDILSSFKSIIEECALRAVEEDMEGVPERERFRVVSHDAGLLIYIVSRASRRQRIAEFSGRGGSTSALAWLAGAASATNGEVTGWETNPRRYLKLQNCLCRSRLSPNVNLCSLDPLWSGEPGLTDERYDCIVISMADPDCPKHLELAWNLLESRGLFFLTNSLEARDECSAAVSAILSSREAATADVATAEGVIVGLKLDDALRMDSKAALWLKKLEDGGQRLMAIPPETGKFLWILTRAAQSSRVLEIGSGGGYSGVWLASALDEAGLLTTIEMDGERAQIARGSYQQAGLAGKVNLIEDDAFKVLPSLAGPFDLVFLDSWKPDYLDLLELIRPLLKPEGLLVADNAVSHASDLKSYIDTVQHDSDLVSVTANIGSGVEVTLKLT